MKIENQARYCIRCGASLITKKDEEGKSRKICPNCGWTFYENPVPASACVVLNDKNEILLIKRKVEPSAGSWALPSGYVEIYQTPAECAIAELEEETGLKGKIKKSLGYYIQDSPICKKVISFGFYMEQTGGTLKAGDDALDARLFPISEIPHLPFASHREFVKIIKKDKGII
jgi:8-oxo-dGTP diphosphatase